MSKQNLIPLKEAQKILQVSHTTMARLVKEGEFIVYQNPLDRRQKLVDIDEVRAYATPVPLKKTEVPAEPLQETKSPPETGSEPTAELEDGELRAATQLLRLLVQAANAERDAPFIQTQSGDILHPGIEDGRINVPPSIFNRLLREGYLRILAGVYHRRGPDVGREFTITTAGHEVLTRR